MNPADLHTLVAALQTIAAVLSGLGVPGLIALGLSGPVVVLVTVLVLDAHRHSRMEKMHQESRSDSHKMLEAYREDLHKMHHDYSNKHADMSRYYENNVMLVKNYEKLTEALQSLVVNNTRTAERPITIIESMRKP